MAGNLPTEEIKYPKYLPTPTEIESINDTMDVFISNRSVMNKSYNQFNGRNLQECIDDWTKRWNGFIPAQNELTDRYQSRIFLNFTRNAVISWLSKVAMQPPKVNIIAVNKKSNLVNRRIAELFKNLNEFSLNEENGPARFLESALECATKGTVVKYEGYKKERQTMKVPLSFDALTGEIKYEKKEVTIFDNCFQQIVPIEDFYISNPYQPEVQKQPTIIWRSITTYDEAKAEFKKYKNWKYVRPGSYSVSNDPTTFYRNSLVTDLQKNQVELVRFYRKKDNVHRILINGVVLYDGPIPFKDGNYPFAKTVNEPFGNDFFWGMSIVQKIMGDQDLKNTLWNMMVDKTYASLLPMGLSSDLDDLIEDDVLEPNKVRKVSDINKWKFLELPPVNNGELSMLQIADRNANEYVGGATGAASASTPRGGKLPVRQVLLQQQEAMQKLGFSMSYLEDFEQDRTKLRINHILQFWSIPKIEKVVGENGKEVEKLLYRDIRLSDVKLENGKVGTRIIKLVGEEETGDENAKQQLADDLSVTESMGEQNGTPTEAVAISVETFYDYNLSIQVVKNSTYEKNAVLDQAVRHEYADWRLSLAQIVPVDATELVNWVSESYDVDTKRFEPKQQASISGPAGQQKPGVQNPQMAQMMSQIGQGGRKGSPVSKSSSRGMGAI